MGSERHQGLTYRGQAINQAAMFNRPELNRSTRNIPTLNRAQWQRSAETPMSDTREATNLTELIHTMERMERENAQVSVDDVVKKVSFFFFTRTHRT